MKIGEKRLTPPSSMRLTIYRTDEEGKPADFEFVCSPVLSYEEFNRLYPTPKAPLVSKIKQGTQYEDTTDKRYLAAASKWSSTRVDWMVITSLRATPGLEWETVKYDDPTTWANYESELKQVLTEHEYDRLLGAVLMANNPNEKSRKEALDSFSATQEPAEETVPVIPQDVPTSTPSGEPAKD